MRAALALLLVAAAPAWADPIEQAPNPYVPSPYAQCDAAIATATKLPGHAPPKLLPTIARVESGRLDAATGKVRPWPWTINVDGVGYFFDSKPEVIAAVQALQAKGKRSIDVGCMQVNLMHHPKAFADLDEAFDPVANARYATRFLTGLYGQTRDWALATAWYHSSTPEHGEEYQRLVFGRVLTPMGAPGGRKEAATAPIWLPPEIRFGAMPPASYNFRAFAPTKPVPATFGGIPMFNVGTSTSLVPAAPARKR